MRIIQFLAALTILLAPALASAQAQPYIEGQIGLLTTVDDGTEKYTDTDPMYQDDLTSHNEYDADISFGLEIGARKIAGTGFRLGLSYSQFNTDETTKKLTGTTVDRSTQTISTPPKQ